MKQTYVARLVGIFPRKYEVRLLASVPYIGAFTDESMMCCGLVKKGAGPPFVNLVAQCNDANQLLCVTLSTTTYDDQTGCTHSAQEVLELGKNLLVVNFRGSDCPLKLLDLDPQWELQDVTLMGACYWFGAYGGMVPKADVVAYLTGFDTISALARAHKQNPAAHFNWHKVLGTAAHVVSISSNALTAKIKVFAVGALQKYGIYVPRDVLDVLEDSLWKSCLSASH